MDVLLMWAGYIKDNRDQITCILLRFDSCSVHRDFDFSIIPGLILHMAITICSTQCALSFSHILHPYTNVHRTLQCVLVLQKKHKPQLGGLVLRLQLF